ncbi:GNAT family N-acetyltransferase [Rugamonas sp. CCM 8940]|uniref:GNAT family N-acetyltransferase n=1 Tax=Rugamonas sp. CCM 8940 TaxID=2765359 RepID=UPI0018F3BDB2|nr:GNAT family N-acetyltransferase [Rugamonas sp. CCM 8940]MBJ7311078.1 GNAT family N-acetyltransferase [Rugamonas sp. CCM 8940]
MKHLHIRQAEAPDAPAIAELIADLLPFVTPAPDGAGAEQFIATMQAEALARCVGDERFHYQLGFIDDALVGAVAVRDKGHLYHLFVARAWHGQGVGRRLWQAARAAAVAAGNVNGFTVNSSLYAEPMYCRFGFVATGPRTEKDGVAYIPMRIV